MTLISGGFEVIIQPAIGRIMRFARQGGPNALWTNPEGYDDDGWNNLGGEKLWLWPQDQWLSELGAEWPPPLEGAKWTATSGADWVEWELPLHPLTTGVIRRVAILNGSMLKVQSTISVAPSTFPFRLWSITQIPRPDRLLIPTNSARIKPAAGTTFDKMPHGWVLKTPPAHGGKWFFDGDSVVASTPGGILTICHSNHSPVAFDDAIEKVQIYFDHEAAVVRPSHLDPYAELEFVAAQGSDSLDLIFHLAE